MSHGQRKQGGGSHATLQTHFFSRHRVGGHSVRTICARPKFRGCTFSVPACFSFINPLPLPPSRTCIHKALQLKVWLRRGTNATCPAFTRQRQNEPEMSFIGSNGTRGELVRDGEGCVTCDNRIARLLHLAGKRKRLERTLLLLGGDRGVR